MSSQPMSPAEFRRIRQDQKYSQAALSDLLGLGKWGGKTVRRWESGSAPISGPVAFAMRALDAGFNPDAQEVQTHE